MRYTDIQHFLPELFILPENDIFEMNMVETLYIVDLTHFILIYIYILYLYMG